MVFMGQKTLELTQEADTNLTLINSFFKKRDQPDQNLSTARLNTNRPEYK